MAKHDINILAIIITLQETQAQVKKLGNRLQEELAALREELKAVVASSEQRLRAEFREAYGQKPTEVENDTVVPPVSCSKANGGPDEDNGNCTGGNTATETVEGSKLGDETVAALQIQAKRLPLQFRVGQYNILAGYLGNNTEPWFLYGVDMPEDRREAIMRLHSERDSDGRIVNAGWPNYVKGILSEEEQAEVELVDREIFAWDQRKHRILDVIRNMETDMLSLVECDHYEDFFKPGLASLGYDSIWKKRPRKGSHDGCCIAWRRVMFELVASTHVEYVDRYDDHAKRDVKDRIALIALLRSTLTGDTMCFVSTHLTRNPENPALDRLRARQIGQVVRILGGFIHKHKADTASVIFAGDMNISSFNRLRGIAMSVALMRQETYVHPFVFDCKDIPTGVTSATSSRNVRIDAMLYQTRRLELVDTNEVPELSVDDPIPNEDHPSDHVPIVGTFRVRTRLQINSKTAREWYLRLAGRDCNLPLNHEQLKDAFKFYDHDGSGSISTREFRNAITEVLGAGVASSEELSTVLSALPAGATSFDAFVDSYVKAIIKDGMPGMDDFREAFEAFDSDQNGSIDVGETIRLFAECCPCEVPEIELMKIFKSMDANSDGEVDINEFCAYLGKVWTTGFAVWRAPSRFRPTRLTQVIRYNLGKRGSMLLKAQNAREPPLDRRLLGWG